VQYGREHLQRLDERRKCLFYFCNHCLLPFLVDCFAASSAAALQISSIAMGVVAGTSGDGVGVSLSVATTNPSWLTRTTTWIKEGWQWMLNRALGFRSHTPKWFRIPVMRRIAISTPNVMAALRRLRRDQARPYNFALSPVLVNLTNVPLTLFAPFEKDSSQWMKLPHVNIHDGTTHTLDNPTLPLLVQTFQMVLQQYHRHPESKSFGPDGTSCKAESAGLLKRYPVTATGFHLIGKETNEGGNRTTISAHSSLRLCSME
jgi:hypothetical protein